MKSVSETLKSAREKKGLDLSFISDALKIREKYLLALEEGNYSVFPSPLYIKGFLKNYAKYLGIDENEILALYRREYNPNLKPDEYSIDKNPIIRTARFVIKPGHIITLLTVLLIISVIGYLGYQYSVFISPPQISVSAPYNNQVTQSPNFIIEGTTSYGNKVLINGQQVPFINNNGSFSYNLNLHNGNNTVEVTVINGFNRSITIKRNLIYSNSGSSVTTNSQSLNARLVISNNNTWVKITADNKVLFQEVLSPGTIKTFTAQNDIIIDTGHPSDTNFSVNGQTVPLSGNGIIEETVTLNQSGDIVVK